MVNLRILNLNGRDFMIRRPAVAGTFYESHPESLKKRIEWCFKHELGPGKLPKFGDKRKIKGVVAPHAGFMTAPRIFVRTWHFVWGRCLGQPSLAKKSWVSRSCQFAPAYIVEMVGTSGFSRGILVRITTRQVSKS